MRDHDPESKTLLTEILEMCRNDEFEPIDFCKISAHADGGPHSPSAHP